MKITEKEFDAVEQGLCVASNEDMLDENVAYPAFEKMKKVYEHYHFLMDELGMYEREELKKEIIRLKSLCRRAADEIRDLDDTIIKITKEFPEVREFLGWKDDDLWAGEASINLLNRLDGRTNGGYIENYEDLLEWFKKVAAHKVMEQHSEAFEKLAENKE